ncbi:MAG: AMP-binding protein [Candidatus Xenobiia bacterium LiM19]
MNAIPSNDHLLTMMDAVQAQLHNAEAPAILAPGQRPLSYGALHMQMQYVAQKIRSLGIGVQDRIALMVPDGPEMAVALLSLASASACVPLNCHLKEGECERYFKEVGVKALIVQKGLDSPGLISAQKNEVRIITLVPLPEDEAGLFRLEGGEECSCGQVNFPQVNDTALILSTSGTTSKPKIIPISQNIICASVKTIVSRAHLSPGDRCLNPMPLHHLYGIQTGVFSSIFSGGSVVCPGGFEPHSFFEWLEEFHPTWFTAVTPMLQSLLSIASSHDEMIRRNPLRFIRSGAVAVPSQLQERVEHLFSAPVSVSYGLTEANPVTSALLPPGKTMPGSVGTPSNMNIAIVDEKGTHLPPGEIGKIIISGLF